MTRQKLSQLLNSIFGWGVFLALIAGSLSFFGFVIALIMGGSGGEALAVYLQKQYFPVLIRITSIVIGIGLIAMYVGKEQALSLASEKESAEQELEQIKRAQKKQDEDDK